MSSLKVSPSIVCLSTYTGTIYSSVSGILCGYLRTRAIRLFLI